MAADDALGKPDVTLTGPAEPDPPTPADPLLLRGANVGRYLVLEPLGKGGMGVVYAAYDPELDRKIAIKLVRPESATPGAQDRLLREAQAMARLSHPNVIVVHDVGAYNDRVFLAMELIDGGTLRQWMQARPPVAEVLRVFALAGRGLAAAHAAGLVHGDFKPDNVLVGRDGRVRVTDFGLARPAGPIGAAPAGGSASPKDPLTGKPPGAPSLLAGTPGYMAPEQREGHPADALADQFSFCVALHEALHGNRPGAGSAPGESRPAPPDSSAQARVPPRLRSILARGLAADRTRRFGSMDALLDALARDPMAGRRRRWTVGALVLLAAAAMAWLARRESRIRWAHQDALPEIARLVETGRLEAAFALAERVERIIPEDPAVARLFKETSIRLPIETSPPGADIYIADYGSTEFRPLGKAPMEARVALAPRQWRILKDGFAPVEGLISNDRRGRPRAWAEKLFFTLDPHPPPGMVRVPGGAISLEVPGFDRAAPRELPDYFIDRFEVTNRQFKQFVDQAGYARRELWTEPLVEAGRTIRWEEAVSRFRDRTGRPGPAGWASGAYPQGQDDFPVTGVSWYEAAAYAAFVGKSLPSVHHWSRAAGMWASGVSVPASNFGGAGLAQVGSHRDLGPYGTHDMYGNAKEWCWNASGDKRYILGGAWNEPSYLFYELDAQAPFARGPANGFRLIQQMGDASLTEAAKGPLPHAQTRDYAAERPVSDAIFEVYRGLYAYDRTDLKASVERVADPSDRFRSERVSFQAAYGSERMAAILYLPKDVPPPWQALVYFPHSNAMRLRSSEDLPLAFFPSFLLQSGRAIVLPIFKSTFERADAMSVGDQEPTKFYRDHVIEWSNDLGRTLDYLATRADFDPRAVAFAGLSWGAKLAPILLAVEPRIRAAVVLGGGFNLFGTLPEVDPFNFAPHVRQPVLLVSGRYDPIFPVGSSQEPFFRALGTAPADKRHVIYETGHVAPGDLSMKEILDWLDRYLGPVRRTEGVWTTSTTR